MNKYKICGDKEFNKKMVDLYNYLAHRNMTGGEVHFQDGIIFKCEIEEYDTEEIKVDKDFEPNWLIEFDGEEIKKVYPFTGKKPYKVKKYGMNQYDAIVKAKDEDHAIKIAIDTLAQYKALKAGLVLTGDKLDNFLKVEEEK